MSLELQLIQNFMLGDILGQLAAEAVSGDALREFEVVIAERTRSVADMMTPVVTGSLASAHTVFVNGAETFVAINPQAANPQSPERPFQYGPKVHQMGGISQSGHDRAFYDVTVNSFGQQILEDAGDLYFTSLQVFR